jgi:EpsI family protein
MTKRRSSWLPVGVLVLGCTLLIGVRAQLSPQLRRPLESVLPKEVDGMGGTDVEVPEAEAQVAAFTDYALRVYQEAGDSVRPGSWASVYLGFYDKQSRGKTIHSPRNCLPGGGWEALASQAQTLQVGGESITVNRYLLQNGSVQAIVLYWYQGRGRVAHNEYLVKWDLLRDAATRRRTDEALVRIVVPIVESEEASFQLASKLAARLKPALDEAMPL